MRAIVGICLGCMLFYGFSAWPAPAAKDVLSIKTQIEAARPGARLEALLTPLLADQNGTSARK